MAQASASVDSSTRKVVRIPGIESFRFGERQSLAPNEVSAFVLAVQLAAMMISDSLTGQFSPDTLGKIDHARREKSLHVERHVDTAVFRDGTETWYFQVFNIEIPFANWNGAELPPKVGFIGAGPNPTKRNDFAHYLKDVLMTPENISTHFPQDDQLGKFVSDMMQVVHHIQADQIFSGWQLPQSNESHVQLGSYVRKMC